ncbi:hypothetical protein NL108_001793 [Boleophthalmus pectinirostris]|nr:hypothetical protein NL108_001793 [Boleophthalmus pectinirostris]
METTSAPSKILERGPDYLRRQMELENETKVGLSAVERLAMSKPKYVKSQQVISTTQEPVISIGQKCDLIKASANDRRHHILRKLQSKSVQESEKDKIPTPEGTTQECTVNVVAPPDEQDGMVTKRNKENSSLLTVHDAPEEFRRSGKGVSRSHSDISSRYSKNFADFDAFFKYCGLGGDVIEMVGKDNFSVHSEELKEHIRSVSVSNSDDGFSRSSGGSDGLQEDEVLDKFRQQTSVIERNARIIKWLYSCRNATETGKKLRDLE